MNRTYFIRTGVLCVVALACLATLPVFGQRIITRKVANKKTPAKTTTTEPTRRTPIIIRTTEPLKGGIEVNKYRFGFDFDNDLKADYVVFHPTTNTWQILKSSGGIINTPFGIASSDYFVPGDYDGDHIADLAVFRDTEHKWYVLLSSNGTTVVTDFGATGDEPVARDYDGDGKTDLAFIHRASGAMNWTYRPSTGGADVTVNWGVAADTAAPADYDGDGKFDIAVRRTGTPAATGTAVFIIKRSSDGAQQNIDWGLGSDLVVSGDYDGDGKADAAVLREGKLRTDPLTWLIKRSSDGTGFMLNFGTTGLDYNVQNDYDGDGATDIAVWNNSTATFSVRRSFTLTTTTQAWGTSNDYPVASYDTH